MNRSVTPPANGGGVSRQAGNEIETPPQESRRRSRRGRSTAVAGLARDGICSPRLVPRTPRHTLRQSSRFFGCAVAARRQLLLLPPKAGGAAAAADPLRSAAGRAQGNWGQEYQIKARVFLKKQ